MNDEQEMLEQEVEDAAQDQDDAFMAGWDEKAPETREAEPQPETQPEAEPQGEGAQAADGHHQAEDAPPATEDGEPAQEQSPEPPPAWEVNVLGERKTMRAQDITPELLQKGLDYDRVHQQFDQTKPVMSLISALAQKSGLSVEDYVTMVRTEAKKSDGVSEEDARRAVALEDREARVAEAEAAQSEARQRREAADAEIQRGVAEFAKAFPEVCAKARSDPKAIPDSVWAAVNGGMSLTAAYAQYAVAQAEQAARAAQTQAQTQAQTAQLNQRNAQRSTGSLRSAGGDTRNKDPFLEGWDD